MQVAFIWLSSVVRFHSFRPKFSSCSLLGRHMLREHDQAGSIPVSSTIRGPFRILDVRRQACRYLSGDERIWGADHRAVIAILHVACGGFESHAPYHFPLLVQQQDARLIGVLSRCKSSATD